MLSFVVCCDTVAMATKLSLGTSWKVKMFPRGNMSLWKVIRQKTMKSVIMASLSVFVFLFLAHLTQASAHKLWTLLVR